MNTKHFSIFNFSNVNCFVFFIPEVEANRVKRDFYQIAGFTNVLGAIDGILIPIMAPKVDEVE